MQKLSGNIIDTCDCVHEDEVRNIKAQLSSDEIYYDIADFFKMFGDSTRVKILYLLLKKSLCVGDIAATLNLEQSAVSHQLKTLRSSRLVKAVKEGKTVVYSLDDSHVESVLNQGFEHVLHGRQ